jgi:hypothetical protein
MSTLVIQDLQNVANYCKQLDAAVATRIVGGSTQPVPIHTVCLSSAKDRESYLSLLNHDRDTWDAWIDGSCVKYACLSDL